MNNAVSSFLLAHDRYLELERLRTECSRPAEREVMYIEVMKAYLEVQYRAKVIAGLQYADGMDFADMQ
jgi:hypothetical protein